MISSDLCRPVVLGQIVEKDIELSHSLPKRREKFIRGIYVSFVGLSLILELFQIFRKNDTFSNIKKNVWNILKYEGRSWNTQIL